MEQKVKIFTSSVQETTTNSKQEPDTTIASTKDLEVVFEAIVNPPGPNQKLRKATEVYKSFIQENK